MHYIIHTNNSRNIDKTLTYIITSDESFININSLSMRRRKANDKMSIVAQCNGNMLACSWSCIETWSIAC